jgi:diaminobutyrate-2-oxoglutarate transaminase
MMEIFDALESEVRSYCRHFPTVFEKGEGYHLIDEKGRGYIDFFSAAGALNYGHNHPAMKKKLLEYIEKNGIAMGLDMATVAKREFIVRFNEVILKPRGMTYKFQFTGPTGSNAVEAAIKLARKETGRQTVMFFFNAFHGMSLGALSLTFNSMKRAAAGVPLNHSVAMPYCNTFGEAEDTIDYMEKFLKNADKRSELPGAAIVETIQGEGGVNVATAEWLQRLDSLLKKYGILLIVDDIQVGCGRTGDFFSFELSGIQPDIIILSKSLSGFGLPFSLVLIKPEIDIWDPGEHCGTFRGNNLAFVTAAEALRYWETDDFSKEIVRKSEILHQWLKEFFEKRSQKLNEIRGRGFIWGIDCGSGEIAGRVSREAFERGLIIETAGRESHVVKVMPPLIIDETGLKKGLGIIQESVDAVL